MTLTELLGDLSSSVFCEKYFTRLPHAVPHGASPLVERLRNNVVADLFARGHPNVLYAKGGRATAGTPARAEAEMLFADGHTVVFRHAEESHPELRKIADDFGRDFGSAVDVQVFWSPAQREGFSWHYDVEDVFIVQCHGTKEFFLRKNTVCPLPTDKSTGGQGAFALESSPMLIRCSLAPGDWLYIPSGYWHKAQAATESVHLSIGITPRTVHDLIEGEVAHPGLEAQWRERLPDYGHPYSSAEELSTRYAEILARLREKCGETVATRASQRSAAIVQARG